jgi:DNA polymerase-1
MPFCPPIGQIAAAAPSSVASRRHNLLVQIGLMVDGEGGGLLRAFADDGAPAEPLQRVTDAAAAVRDRELADRPRWLWASTAATYPALLRAGVRIARCHDLALTEAILLAYAGRWGEPKSLPAAWARLHGLPVPDDVEPVPARQPALFELDRPGVPEGDGLLAAAGEVFADQQRRIAATEHPERLRLLVAAESAGALAAVEMGEAGMPWRSDVHDRLLTELLGPRPAPGMPPRRLRELTERIADAFGEQVNPDSPAQVVRAFAGAGIAVPSTRMHVLREVRHPAVPLLFEYKELSRLYSAYGWSWLDAWVRQGRMRPEYVPGGVVSGRWATRGGGALQIPHAVRQAAVAEPGRALVVADAAQLEPRVLAALSDDEGLARAARGGDLYGGLAAAAFQGDRPRAKVALLAAMYGQTSGQGGQLIGVLRRRFPDAVGYVEAAARAGEEGRLVRSRLGRTCPPPSAAWRERTAAIGRTPDAEHDGDEREDLRLARQSARDRGRFTRNFVVQASAADWALTMLAALRRRLDAPGRGGAELVLFQHDEVVVDCPVADAPEVVEAVGEAADEAGRLVFGDTPVRFPLESAVVSCYADAK